MEINYPITILILLAVIVLIIVMIKRDRKDEKDFENTVNQSELEPEDHKKKDM